jgi:DNA-3-methyladenine glycosylase
MGSPRYDEVVELLKQTNVPAAVGAGAAGTATAAGLGADACGRRHEPRFEAPTDSVDPALVRSGPRVGVNGPGGDGAAFPWRFWLDGEPTVSAYRPGVVRKRR